MRHLALERLGCPAVVDHVVGSGEALLARGLRGENGTHFRLREAGSPHGALDLLHLGAIDHEHPRVARPVDAALHQERDHENCVGALRARAPARAFLAYERMQDRLELFSRRRVAEHELAHPVTIEGAVRADRACAERSAYRFDRLASRARELVGDLVGVDHGNPAFGEQPGDHALAAADAARESDRVRLHMNWLKYWRVIWGPQNRATIPAAPKYGPKGIGTLRPCRRKTTRAIPTAAPMKDDSRIVSGKACHPHHAPIAASSLKSPNPIPSLPVTSLNSQYTLQRARYPAAAPITAERRSVKTPAALTNNPSHKSGSVIESGSSWVSKSMKVAAMMHHRNAIAANAAGPAPKCTADQAAAAPPSSSTSG